MSSELTLNKTNLDKILNTLRSPKNGKLFTDIVEENWEKLGLDGNPNPKLLENLLIKIIEKLYGNQNTNPTVDLRDQARRYDISLLTFGLLDGYYHTKIDQGIRQTTSSTVRYNQYLATNVFVNLDYPAEGTYGEIVVKDKIAHPGNQPRPLNKLTSISGKCRVEICNALLKSIRSGDYKNCSQDALFDERTGQRTDLPKPHFTLENFPPKGQRGATLPRPEPFSIQPDPPIEQPGGDYQGTPFLKKVFVIILVFILFGYFPLLSKIDRIPTVQINVSLSYQNEVVAHERATFELEGIADNLERIANKLEALVTAKDASASSNKQMPSDGAIPIQPPNDTNRETIQERVFD